MNTIFTIGIFMSFFLSLLLVTKKNNFLSDKLLATWMFIIGIHLASYYMYSIGYWEKYPHLIGTIVPIPLLHGPLLYLYTLYSLRNENSMRKQDYLHIAPSILFFLYMCKFYFFYSADEKIMVDNGLLDEHSLFPIFALISYIISGLTYPVLSYRLLGIYKTLLNDNFSYDHRISLDWLKYSIWGIGSVYLAVAVISIIREGFGVQFSFNADYIFYSMIVIFVFCIGFFGIRRENLFSEIKTDNKPQLVREKPTRDYKKSGLKPEVAREVHQKLKLLMSDSKLYTNPKLTLSELADKVEVSPNNLSQVINQYEQVNFHDYVNKYRIDEFINIAMTNTKFNLFSLALDAGFNSKSSFNSVFKKHQGVTPSKYIAQLSA